MIISPYLERKLAAGFFLAFSTSKGYLCNVNLKAQRRVVEKIPSLLLTRSNKMALKVQMYKIHNHLTGEDLVIPRLVNQQTLDFNGLCDYLADGATVTAADVAAVMKLIELRLPLLLGLNVKVICSPEGLTFRPSVSGSISQKQLREKLQARQAADPTLNIDVNRELSVSDLTISDLTADIGIELPKMWIDRFKTKAEFKRVSKTSNEESSEPDPDAPSTDGGGNSGGTSGGSNTSGTNGGNTGGEGGEPNPDGSTED